MSRFDRFYRPIVAASTVLAMAALWAGSIVYWMPAEPAAIVSDARANPGGLLATAVFEFIMAACLAVTAVGVAAIVQGRGRVFCVLVASLLGIGLIAHSGGGFYYLILERLSNADLPADTAARAVGAAQSLIGVYLLLLIPFLLGLTLLPAALWRARVVSWKPLALVIAAQLISLPSSATPDDIGWWASPFLFMACYLWLAVGLLRYRPAAPLARQPEGSVPAMA